mmetsp:Transcript_2035/g.2119  ORF Transcript_2035/g.2119 Transcript_2035/m.2119 type:complete len:203 (-) Transcript_2035:190-798(-)
MYLILFVCAVLFPIVYLNIDPSPATLLMITAVGFIISTFLCSLLLFGPKIMLLLEGADVNDRFEIVRSDNTSSHQSSSNALQHVKNKVMTKIHDKITLSRLSSIEKDSHFITHIVSPKETKKENDTIREAGHDLKLASPVEYLQPPSDKVSVFYSREGDDNKVFIKKSVVPESKDDELTEAAHGRAYDFRDIHHADSSKSLK